MPGPGPGSFGVPNVPRTIPAVKQFSPIATSIVASGNPGLVTVNLSASNLASGSAGFSNSQPILSYDIDALINTQPRQDSAPAFSLVGTLWSDTALFAPLSVWTVNEYQLQVAAYNAVVAANLIVTEYQFDVAKYNASIASNLVVTEQQRLIAALTASIATTLGANGLTYIIDSAELFSPLTVWTVKEYQLQVSALSSIVASNISVNEHQIDVAALSAIISSGLGANVSSPQQYISSLLAPLTSFVVIERQLEIAALSASVVSNLGANATSPQQFISSLLLPATSLVVKEFQYLAAAFSPNIATAIAANATSPQQYISSLLSPSSVSTVTEHQLEIAAIAAAVATNAIVNERQYQVAAWSASDSAILGAALNFAGPNVWSDSALFAPITNLIVSEHQLDVAAFSATVPVSLGANLSGPEQFISTLLASSMLCTVLERQYLVAAFDPSIAANLGANATSPQQFISSGLLPVTGLKVSASQWIPDHSSLTSSSTLSSVSYQLEAILSSLLPVANLSANISTFIFDYEGFASSLELLIDEYQLDIASSSLSSGSGLAANAILFGRGSLFAENLATDAAGIDEPIFELLFPLSAQTVASQAIFIDRPVFIGFNKNTLYPTLRKLEGLSRLPPNRIPPVVGPPFTSSQVRQMKRFTENTLRKLNNPFG